MSLLFALATQLSAQQPPQSPAFSQADLDALSDTCRAPREWLELRGIEIVIRAMPDTRSAKLKCVLKKVSAVLAEANSGSVGNAPASEEK